MIYPSWNSTALILARSSWHCMKTNQLSSRAQEAPSSPSNYTIKVTEVFLKKYNYLQPCRFKSWTHTGSMTLDKLSMSLSLFTKSQNCKNSTSHIFLSQLFWETDDKMISEITWQNYKTFFGYGLLRRSDTVQHMWDATIRKNYTNSILRIQCHVLLLH